MRRGAIVAALLGTGGCLWENPGFDPTSAGASESGGASSGGAGSTGGAGSGSDGSSDGGTTGGATEGATGGGTTGGTTGGMLGIIDCPDHPDLVACYLFENEPFAKLLDRSGHMLDFSMENVTLVDGPPNYGSAGAFSAQSVVKIDEVPAFDLDAVTISMLVNPAGGDGQILDNDQQYGIRLGNGQIGCRVVPASAEPLEVTAPISVGVWSHVFCTFDGQWLAVSVEGTGEQAPLMGALKKDATNGVVIGNENPAFDLPFVGSIDHVLVFAAGLPEAERCKYGLNPCP